MEKQSFLSFATQYKDVFSLIVPILIPLLIWGLTWFYSSQRFERRKRLIDLENNLNLLLSMLGQNLVKMIALRTMILEIQSIESKPKDNITVDEYHKIIQCIFTTDFLKELKVSDFAQCMHYNDEFVISLIKMMNVSAMIGQKLDHRNNILKTIFSKPDSPEKKQKILDFIYTNHQENIEFLKEIENSILYSFSMIEDIQKLDIKYIKLVSVTYDSNTEKVVNTIQAKNIKSGK